MGSTAASVRSCTEAALGAIGCSHLALSGKVEGRGEAERCRRMSGRVVGDGRQQNHKHWPGSQAGVWRAGHCVVTQAWRCSEDSLLLVRSGWVAWESAELQGAACLQQAPGNGCVCMWP